jgi:hypothetical protein
VEGHYGGPLANAAFEVDQGVEGMSWINTGETSLPAFG